MCWKPALMRPCEGLKWWLIHLAHRGLSGPARTPRVINRFLLLSVSLTHSKVTAVAAWWRQAQAPLWELSWA